MGSLGPEFLYELRYQLVNGRWMLVEVRVARRPRDWGTRIWDASTRPQLDDPGAPPPTDGISARQLRQIPFGMFGPFGTSLKMIERYRRSPWRSVPLERGRIRLARIAQGYSEALRRGSRRPNVDVAAQLKISASAVRDAVHQARLQGLLTQTRKKGVIEGDLTAVARELLGLEG